MNSFAHALAYFDQPYFAVGTCVPDWLTACDRRCRARKKRAADWVEDSDHVVGSVAAGVVQHHQDDYWFHGSEIFTRLTMQLAIEYRQRFGNSQTMRANLIGHIVIEMLLDAWLESQFPGSIQQMYDWLSQLDAAKIEAAVNRFATRPTTKLADEIQRFLTVQYLFDYAADQGVRFRMNKVLGQLKLEPMPEDSVPWIGEKRKLIYQHAPDLLAQHAVLKDR